MPSTASRCFDIWFSRAYALPFHLMVVRKLSLFLKMDPHLISPACLITMALIAPFQSFKRANDLTMESIDVPLEASSTNRYTDFESCLKIGPVWASLASSSSCRDPEIPKYASSCKWLVNSLGTTESDLSTYKRRPWAHKFWTGCLRKGGTRKYFFVVSVITY